MLELQTLACGYGAFGAVHDLTLTLRAGTLTALLGANGAGKSSTLMCIAGHVAQQGGQMLLDGQDIGRLPPTELHKPMPRATNTHPPHRRRPIAIARHQFHRVCARAVNQQRDRPLIASHRHLQGIRMK